MFTLTELSRGNFKVVILLHFQSHKHRYIYPIAQIINEYTISSQTHCQSPLRFCSDYPFRYLSIYQIRFLSLKNE